MAEFAANTCPIDSQVGIANVGVSVPGLSGIAIPFNTAIYNLIPPPEEAGLLGFKVFAFDTPVFTVLSARTGTDYGLDVNGTSIPHVWPLMYLQQVLWGVPAAPIHNRLRLNPADNPYGGTAYAGELCNANEERSANESNEPIINVEPSELVQPCAFSLNGFTLPPVPSNSPEAPFLQNPTTCGSSLDSELEVLSYDGGITNATSPWPQMTGCDQLSFNPSLYAQPTTSATDSASGIDVNLSVPQQFSASTPSPTELRAATVDLPEGFSINPNAADGKTSCSDGEARFGTTEEAQCPEDSKVGSLTIESSALPGPLPGFVYLGQPEPGNRYRIFLVANGFATHVKLAGIVTANRQTGQLTITFAELPQTPLTAFNMHFFGSERGLLATPTRCGTYPVTSTFTPYDASLPEQTSTQYFTLTSGPDDHECPGSTRPFTPGFQAGSLGHSAGTHSTFAVELTRPDGDQNLMSLTVTTPPGLLATLKGIPYCADAALSAAAEPSYSGLEEVANPSCPSASQVGTAIAGVGAGTHPLYVSGRAYLAGPYRGAPLSLAVITPAVAGPYDLGNVVLRVALHVNPETGEITAVSDSLPKILEGIPLRLRSVRIELNRPNFTLNPTNCDPFSVDAQVGGTEGAQANLEETFQVGNCGTLPFTPKLATTITGSTNHTGNPSLHSVLTYPQAGVNANIARVVVTLPHSEFLDNAHIRSPCTRVQFSGNQCPPGSLLGFAKAETPLLEKPLEGPVYLRANGGERKLPDIVVALKGQIDIDLVGFVESIHGQLRTTFDTVPDAPVSRFTLDLEGGNKGLLINSTNLCTSTQHVSVKMTGQNGKTVSQNPVLGNPCTGRADKRKRTRSRG